MIEFIRRRFWLLARYGIAGGTALLVQTALMYVWVSVLGLTDRYLLGATLAFVVATALAFVLQRYWTFRQGGVAGAERQFALYFSIAIGNLCLTLLLLTLARASFTALGADFFAHWYLVAQVAVALFCALMSFLLNYFFTFRKKAEPAA